MPLWNFDSVVMNLKKGATSDGLNEPNFGSVA